MQFNRYYASALFAFVVWGTFGFALKPLAVYPSLDILFYRVFLCGILLAALTFLVRKKAWKKDADTFRSLAPAEKKQMAFLVLAGGFLLTANWFFFIYAMNHISIKAASFAYLVCPILTTVLAFFILREKLTRLQWVSFFISALSCILLGYNHLRDLLFSLIVAISYALYLISQRKTVRFDKMNILSVQMLFSCALLLPFFPAFESGTEKTAFFWQMLCVIAVVYTIMPLFLNLYALQGVNSSTMGVMLYINPLMNFSIAYWFFNEPISTLQLVSYGMIIFSIVLFNHKLWLKEATAV